MSVNLTDGTIPFTELCERVMSMAKMDSLNNEDYVRGLVNDVYVRVLPRLSDWEPLIKQGNILTTAWYNTGTVSCAAAGTSVTGVGTTWTTGMTAANGWKLKFAGNDTIYAFTYASPTTGTISPALSGSTNISGSGYYLVRDEYALASDFDRFLRNGSFYVIYDGLQRDVLAESPRDKFREEFYPYPNDPIWRLTQSGVQSTTGYKQIWVNPAPQTARNYPYEYIPRIAPMRDYRSGPTNTTVSVANGSDTVTGSGTYWASNVAVGDYFRVDANGRGDSSKWYQVSSVTSNTEIVLTSLYAEASESALEYSISKAPTAYPTEFHEFILYDACAAASTTEGDPASNTFMARRSDILAGLNKNYKSRRTNQQFGVYDGGYR